MSNDIRIRAYLEDHVSSALDKIKDKSNLLGGQGTAQSLFGNIGAKAASAAFGLVEGAAQSVVGALGDVVQSGIEGERANARLQASLKANIPAWTGNTAAIDKAVEANQNLGFSDDETKDSLTRLVAATHDVNKALEIQRVAMDLARFKGISLSDATDALTKVEAGSYRILKSLGIELQKGATQQEALTAVEKVAAGQASDYANTVGGKLLVAQTKFNDSLQHLGEEILPLVADGLNAVSGAADGLAASADAFSRNPFTGISGPKLDKGFLDLITHLHDTGTALDNGAMHADQWRSEMGDAIDLTAGKFASGERSVARSSNGMVRKLLADKDALITGYFDVLIEKDNLIATNADIVAQKKILAAKKSTAEERRNAKAALDQDRADQFAELEDLAKNGQSKSKVFHDTLAGLVNELKTAHGQDKLVIQQEIAYLKLLAAQAQHTDTAIARVTDAKAALAYQLAHPGKNTGPHAGGGIIPAGYSGTAGEEGTEGLYALPGGGVVITPHGGGSGGGGTVININSIWPPTPAQVRAIAAVVDEAQAARLTGAAPTLGRT